MDNHRALGPVPPTRIYQPDDPIIWIDEVEADAVFDAKLQAFLEVEHGDQPARSWMLRGL